ncbi:hypothetical protein BDN72DRAFT_619918 [Pluteus cervinus]|uniref:Uncharacterized protein n=1 Tax=Pluteus cervinus TaxID=181527 RepID=A0ACD3AVE6_9AGAR|nr:hypothetical protein BDN72DRAFT_619918 [Pluteus cervinus]
MGATTTNTTTPTNNKTAEFARLVDLFDRLTMRGQSGTTVLNSTTNDVVRPVTVVIPDDLAPVVKGLSNVMGNNIKLDDRSIRARGPIKTPVTCRVVPQKTVPPTRTANLDDPVDDLERDKDLDEADMKGEYVHEENELGAHAAEEEFLDGFPVGKQYPFTFKLMLHKLYGLDQWAKKVREVLETSQREFKPLAEQELLATPKADNDKDLLFGRASSIRRSPVTPLKKHRDGGSPVYMSRSISFGDGGCSPKPSPSNSNPGEVHAVKKRLVGRRKSIVDVEKAANGWVYNAKVSFADTNSKIQTSGQPTPTYVFVPQVDGLNPKEKIERRRRALSPAGLEEVERKQVKRPLAF